MFTPSQYRARADEYSELIKGTSNPCEIKEFQRLEHNFTELADNGDWMANNLNKTVQREDALGTVTPADEEAHILRCLGASVIMQWNTLPTKLQKELFDNASSVGELLQTSAFRQQMARFLHKHKDDEAGLKTWTAPEC
jgi:hypothetical protein